MGTTPTSYPSTICQKRIPLPPPCARGGIDHETVGCVSNEDQPGTSTGNTRMMDTWKERARKSNQHFNWHAALSGQIALACACVHTGC